MIDENAFGVLVSYLTIEEDEYQSDDTAPFVDRVAYFERTCLDALNTAELGPHTTAVSFGHAFYVELPESEERPKVIAFLRAVRQSLTDAELTSAGILAYGGRWVAQEDTAELSISDGPEARVATVSRPSEPLRKALHAETACHGMGNEPGWGPGLYFDTEAVEALGLSPKNQPTPLTVADATFFRAGR